MEQKTKNYYVEKPVSDDGVEFFLIHAEENAVCTMAHIHQAVEFLYIKQGTFLISADSDELEAREGDLVVFRSGTIHSIYYLGDLPRGEYYVIKINPRVLLDLCGESVGASYIMEFVVKRPGAKWIERKEDLISSAVPQSIEAMIREFSAPTEYSNLVYKTHAIELLIHFLKQRSSKESAQIHGDLTTLMIYKTVTLINAKYNEPIDALGCAEAANMSYSHFSRSFKRITGATFKEYLNTVRIDRARKLLLTTDKSVTEVALECGYNNLSYFIMLYRKMRGVTPNEERK